MASYALGIVKGNYDYLSSRVGGTLLTVSELQSAYAIVVSFEGYVRFIERRYNTLTVKEVPAANMVAYLPISSARNR